MMKRSIEFSNSGAPLSEATARAFELVNGVRVPDSYVQALITLSNGGSPRLPYRLPVYGVDGIDVQWAHFHGLYGIGHSNRSFDLADALTDRLEHLGSIAFPIGYDELDGAIVIRLDEPYCGEVWYQPWGDWTPDPKDSLYFVANSLPEFFDALQLPEL